MKSNCPQSELNYLEDQAVWKLYLDGNHKALAILYRRYYKPMYLRAYRLSRDSEAAHDITQETFLKLLQLADKFAHEGLVIENMQAWLYTWVKKIAQNYQKKNNRRSEILRKNVIPYLSKYSYIDELSEQDLINAVTSLSNPTYQIILALDYVGYTNKEIAEIFDKPTKWINQNRYKAKKALLNSYNK